MRILRSFVGAVAFAAVALLAVAPASAQNLKFDVWTPYHRFVDDFDNYLASEWIITTTEAGAGDATEAIADADGGILVITNDANDNDLDFLQWSGDTSTAARETFTFTAGKAMLIKARFKIFDAVESDFILGLQITDTTALAVSDGIWFGKDDGDALLDFHVAASSTQTNVTGIATLASDTYTEVAAYYDGSNARFTLYVNGVSVGTAAITNAPSTELTVSFGLQNGSAAATHVLSLDYIAVVKAR